MADSVYVLKFRAEAYDDPFSLHVVCASREIAKREAHKHANQIADGFGLQHANLWWMPAHGGHEYAYIGGEAYVIEERRYVAN